MKTEEEKDKICKNCNNCLRLVFAGCGFRCELKNQRVKTYDTCDEFTPKQPIEDHAYDKDYPLK